MIARSIALALLLATPLGTVAAQAEVVAAQPELARIPLTLTSASGAHRYSVELARTDDQQEVGLMFRTRMKRDAGMLFPMAQARPASFWMHNTVLPLDLVFVAANGTVRNVAADAVPFSPALLNSDGPVVAVLELNAGEAKRIGLKPGDRVDYRLP